MDLQSTTTPAARRSVVWIAAHGFVIALLFSQSLYCTFQVFVSLQPAGVTGPLWLHAAEVPFELVVARRLYAIEGWIAFVGLAIYLGITEIRPRIAEPR